MAVNFTQVRNSKELRLDNCGMFNTRIGTVNKKTTESFYIKSKIKLVNNDNCDDIANRLRSVKSGFKKEIERVVRADNRVSDNIVYDIQYSDSGLTYKNMTYFKYEVFMKPVETGDFSDKEEYIACIARNLNEKLDTLLVESELK